MQNVYIYGTGDYAHRLYDYLKNESDIRIIGFIKTLAQPNEIVNELKVISLDEIFNNHKDEKILIAMADRIAINQIRMKLIAMGIDRKYIIDCAGFIEANLPQKKKRCTICGNSIDEYWPGQTVGSELFDLHHVIGGGARNNMICPICKSIDRVRWLYYVLATQTDIFSSENSILHFAPESFIRERLQASCSQYVPADINPDDTMIKIDIKDILFRNNTFDYIIANHVLEHIDDLGQAMSELKRVLKPNGKIIISFPICIDQVTIEGKEEMTLNDRVRLFGQEDHVRLFGNDYKEIIESYGFVVKQYVPKELLDKEDIECGGFIEDDVIMICSKISGM